MILKNLIYIYQLEQYDKKRFLSFVYKNLNWLRLNQRGELKRTPRSMLIFFLDILFIASVAAAVWYFVGALWAFAFLLFSAVFLPFIVIFADILIAPFVLFRKNKIVKDAEKIIRSNKERGLITIGITGSFGKTSMKNILARVLGEKYKIFTFPGNVNTDIGVAQYLIKREEELEGADILISEMGAYGKGEIKKMCGIVQPDYSIITSIGECHLDRFGSLENIISAKFELANATEKKVFLNARDENIEKNADAEVAGNVRVVKARGNKEVENLEYLPDFGGISFEYGGNVFTAKLVADYVADFSVIAFKIAEELGMSVLEMKNGLKKVDFTPHRLEIIRNKELNRTIIDDSYNGNYAGFLAGLRVLSRANGRKVVLTPGIVELGEKRSKETHEDLAKKYSENADLVLLIKNENVIFIINKFKELGYNNFKVYESAKEAHEDLANVLKNGDTVIFQNDVPDNYS